MEIRKNSLSSKGLSMSQAQTISNLCNQKCVDIDNTINTINNCSRELIQKVSGVFNDENSYCIDKGRPMPENIINLLIEKCNYHACQAFLMENIKAKDEMINSLKRESFKNDIEAPERGDLEQAKLSILVDEEWG